MKETPKLSSFEGGWIVEKDIDDALAGKGHFTGTARFTRQNSVLLYEEHGVLTPAGAAQGFDAERRYTWRQENGWLGIFFEDGRPFHAIPLGVADPDATHNCDPDRYHVAYDFTHWPQWTAIWTVKGPRKDYVMSVTYCRP